MFNWILVPSLPLIITLLLCSPLACKGEFDVSFTRTILLMGDLLSEMRLDEFCSNVLLIEYVERASFHSSFFSRLLLKRFGSYTLQFFFLPRTIQYKLLLLYHLIDIDIIIMHDILTFHYWDIVLVIRLFTDNKKFFHLFIS